MVERPFVIVGSNLSITIVWMAAFGAKQKPSLAPPGFRFCTQSRHFERGALRDDPRA
jgi:hypothetical protein